MSRLFKLLDKRSNYILTFVAFFILILPIPTPGLSIILALPAIFITAQTCITNQRIWIPQYISQIKISKKIITNIDNISKKYLNFIEKLTRKRLLFLTSQKLNKFYNIYLLILALSSAVPVPVVCQVPAIAGVLLSAGLIVKDGLLVLVSFIIGTTGISLLYATIKAFLFVKDYLVL